MNPDLIHGTDVECKKAFLATMGTELQYPCTCVGLYNKDEQRCKILHDVLHNRSHFSEYSFCLTLNHLSLYNYGAYTLVTFLCDL